MRHTCAIVGRVAKYSLHSTGNRMPFIRGAAGAAASGRLLRMPPRAHFIGHLLRSLTIASTVIGGGLFIGMAGYRGFGRMSWQESFYYASMILSGEGPPADPVTLG